MSETLALAPATETTTTAPATIARRVKPAKRIPSEFKAPKASENTAPKTTEKPVSRPVFDADKMTASTLRKAGAALPVAPFEAPDNGGEIKAGALTALTELPPEAAKCLAGAVSSSLGVDKELTRAARLTANAAYEKAAPQLVTLFLQKMDADPILKGLKRQARRYFEAWGFSFMDKPFFEVDRIRDRRQQAAVREKMRRTTIARFKYDDDARAERASAEADHVRKADPTIRVAEAATRVAEAAKRKAAAERDKRVPDQQKVTFYESEAHFARTAAECAALIEFIDVQGLDPAKVLKFVKSLKELDALK